MARDPLGRRALFSPPPSNGTEPPPASDGDATGERLRGRAALFSGAVPGSGHFAVRCSGCHATSRLRLAELLWRRLPLPLWAPWQRHPWMLTCPACGRRRWAAVAWRR